MNELIFEVLDHIAPIISSRCKRLFENGKPFDRFLTEMESETLLTRLYTFQLNERVDQNVIDTIIDFVSHSKKLAENLDILQNNVRIYEINLLSVKRKLFFNI